MLLGNLVRDVFKLGYSRFTDESKVSFLLAGKSFFIVFAVFHYYRFDTFFDTELEKAHDYSLARIN